MLACSPAELVTLSRGVRTCSFAVTCRVRKHAVVVLVGPRSQKPRWSVAGGAPRPPTPPLGRQARPSPPSGRNSPSSLAQTRDTFTHVRVLGTRGDTMPANVAVGTCGHPMTAQQP